MQYLQQDGVDTGFAVGGVVQIGHGSTVRISVGARRLDARRLGGPRLWGVPDRDRLALAAGHRADRALASAAAVQGVDGAVAGAARAGRPARPRPTLADTAT